MLRVYLAYYFESYNDSRISPIILVPICRRVTQSLYLIGNIIWSQTYSYTTPSFPFSVCGRKFNAMFVAILIKSRPAHCAPVCNLGASRSLINESLVTVFHSHLRHIEQAVRSDRLKKTDPKFVQRNAAFLLDTLLSLVRELTKFTRRHICPKS